MGTVSKSEIKFQLLNELTKPTARDKQFRVGPSDLGNPCPHCLGRKLSATEVSGESDFSLYPWLGTAVHAYLERKVFQTEDFLHEQRLYVGDIELYGPVKGTADLVHSQATEKLGTFVGDWKIVGIKKIKSYRVNGAPKQYRYQAQLYARGCELAGMPVDSIAIIFIPRDSGNVNDIYVYEEGYQPEMAQAALNRASAIYKEVLAGEGYESLPSDPDCFVCNYAQW
jgi:hypothetical protein